MPPFIVDQPWPPDTGEDLRHPDGQLIVCPTTGRTLRAYHDQLIIWAALAPVSLSALPVNFTLFPLVLDTGFNDSFLMQQQQAEVWATPAVFARFARTGAYLNAGREQIPGWNAVLWIYPNVPGTRAPDPSRAPIWLNLPLGATFTPPGSAFTKEKPLLGLRAIRLNRLSLRIDGAGGRFSLDAP